MKRTDNKMDVPVAEEGSTGLVEGRIAGERIGLGEDRSNYTSISIAILSSPVSHNGCLGSDDKTWGYDNGQGQCAGTTYAC